MTPDKVHLAYTEVMIPVNAKVTLNAWHIMPTAPKARLVAVMQFHGNAENRSTHFRSVAWLAEAGVDVVTFDYRGYDGSTGTPSRSGLIEDGVAALKWFEQKFPDHKRFVIGQSLGGAVSIPSIVKSGVKLDGIVLESTFHSYRGIARMKMASAWLFWPFQWLPWILLSGDEDPIDVASQIMVPVLGFHDRYDPVVPLEAGKLLYDALPDATTRILISDGNFHVGAFNEDRSDARQAVLKFIGL